MKKVVHLFASQRVNRKARTDNEEVFREKVTLITNKQMSIGTLADFARLVEDMGICGIVIGNKKVIIKANQTSIMGSDGIPIALFDTEGKKLNANLIDAKTIVTKGLQAGDIDANNAEISNLVITGSMRSKYAEVKVGNELSAVDNINVGSGNAWVNTFRLSWESKMIGRTIRISNGTASAASIAAPADKKFLIDGEKLEALNIMPYSCVILHGYGQGEDFIYWVVENRYKYGLNSASQGGRFEPIRTSPMPVLSRGCVMVTYSYGSWNLDLNQNTPSGQISISRIGTGWYRMWLPTQWSGYFKKNSGLPLYNQILVMLTGYGSIFYNVTDDKASPSKATVKQIGWVDSSQFQAYVDVWVSDDNTPNDGSFAYAIYLMDYDDAISK
jgi:hypothetical protein|nr:MAG TPA_asm: hypothetical protein [Caudoviricetes sp.]